MTPHRYAVVKIDNATATNIRMTIARGTGMVWHQNGDEVNWHGEINEDCQVIWMDDVGTQQQVLQYMLNNFPDNSYACMTTTEVAYVPRGETQRAVFTDAGLMPA